ncbi:MAG: 1,6-anhydro-N-acetylmuramyl-L-alanine amidase AmpD [Methylococcaceae bacterium]|nr:1,6-anhydro-N-acetylmuramyl-L-alanine amidase AmpD [Methylococcaceae bacterium]
MHIDQHWLSGADHIASPNFDERPIADDISLIVVHCISLPPGEFGNSFINDLFCNRLNPEGHPYFKEIYQLKVSSHLLIKRTGDIVQYVPFDKRAWHAGVSNYEGRERCNDFSIGIELEGTESNPYTEVQYRQLGIITNMLLTAYPKLARERITGHNNIAPGRKTDPGESFDWKKFYSLLE